MYYYISTVMLYFSWKTRISQSALLIRHNTEEYVKKKSELVVSPSLPSGTIGNPEIAPGVAHSP